MQAVFLACLLPLAAAGPCDIYDASGTPCVAAFSTLRALFSTYSGPLYTVRRASDNLTAPIPVLSPGGYANSTVQDLFCADSPCVIYHLVDQSAYGNTLAPAPPGGAARHIDNGVNASALPVQLPGGGRAYGMHFVKGGNQGYRLDLTNNIAQGNEAETIYMVTSGLEEYNNDACCYDFGNAEANNLDTGEGSMEAVYMGLTNTTTKGWCGGVGPGPHIMADLESGIWACSDRPGVNPGTVSMTSTFVTAMVKGFGDVAPYGRWMLRGGNAAAGPLVTQFDGPRPAQGVKRAPYYPMRLTGSIILGIGGDNSDGASGLFFEGIMLKGASTEAADTAVQADITAFYSGVTLV